MKQLLYISLGIVLLTAVCYAGAIKDGSLVGQSDNNVIRLSWVGDDETSVRGYSVERKAGVNGQFVLLTPTPIGAEGRGFNYVFEDNSAFRVTDNVYQYRITAVGTGAVYHVTVTHTVSSVRRTWGSIKAMFR